MAQTRPQGPRINWTKIGLTKVPMVNFSDLFSQMLVGLGWVVAPLLQSFWAGNGNTKLTPTGKFPVPETRLQPQVLRTYFPLEGMVDTYLTRHSTAPVSKAASKI